jgi:hypothetical protein
MKYPSGSIASTDGGRGGSRPRGLRAPGEGRATGFLAAFAAGFLAGFAAAFLGAFAAAFLGAFAAAFLGAFAAGFLDGFLAEGAATFLAGFARVAAFGDAFLRFSAMVSVERRGSCPASSAGGPRRKGSGGVPPVSLGKGPGGVQSDRAPGTPRSHRP